MKIQLAAVLLGMGLCCAFNSAMCSEKADSVERAARVMIKDNIVLVRSFVQYFDNATNEHWYTHGRDYLVKFNIHDREARALFNKDGRLVYSILFGTEKNLPDDIRYEVRSNYFDYHITKTSEVKEAGRIIWVIDMINDEKHLTLRVENNEMEEVLKFIKD